MKNIIRFTLFVVIFSFGVQNLIARDKKLKKQQVETKVEVLYFHGKQRCPTCIAVGNESQTVVNKNFAVQQKKGLVKFKEIDISTPEGEKLADQYKVSWSSLFVNQCKNGKEQRSDMTSFGFEYAKSNPQAFRNGLVNKINQMLK